MNLSMPANKLFLAVYVLVHQRYMGNREVFEHQHRLVWADDEKQAREKLLKAETRDDPYGLSIDVEGLELHEAIV